MQGRSHLASATKNGIVAFESGNAKYMKINHLLRSILNAGTIDEEANS